MQHPPNPQTAIRLNVGQAPGGPAIGGGYAQAPSTPRPTFASETSRPTVYGPPPGTMFGNSGAASPGSNGSFILQQVRPDQQQPQQQQQFQSNVLQQPQAQQQIPENNRQLRDLLQRQQMITPNMPSIIGNQTPQINSQNATLSPRWNQQGDGVTSPMDDQSSQITQQLHQQQQQSIPPDANTFRTPLPPGMVQRPQRGPPPQGKIIRQGQIIQHGPRTMIMSGDMRQRFIRPPGNLIAGQQQMSLQQQPNIVHMQQQQQLNQQQFQTLPPTGQRIQINATEMGSNLNPVMSSDTPPTPAEQSAELATALQKQQAAAAAAGPGAVSDSDTPEIPDNVTAELEKLEDENGVMGEVEGVGDLLGDLGEDDDDELFNSLTAEMGADFNILEYADPELDDLNDGEKANLLDSLDFGEAEPERGLVKKDPPDPLESTVNISQHHQTPIESTPQKLDSVVAASISTAGPENSEPNAFSVSDNNARQLHQQTMQQQIIGQPNPMNIAGQHQQPQQLTQQQLQIQQQQLNRMKALQQGPNAQAKLQHIQQQMLQQVTTQHLVI